MLGKLHDLPLGDAADLIQVQAALALDGFRIFRGTRKGVANHDQSSDGHASHDENEI